MADTSDRPEDPVEMTAMELDITEDAVELLAKRGGVLVVDLIRAVG